MSDLQLVMVVVFTLAAMFGILIGGTWLVMRIGMIRNPIGASMFVTAVVTALTQLPNGRILTDWWGILLNAFVLGLPIGLVWWFARRRKRKLSAEESAL